MGVEAADRSRAIVAVNPRSGLKTHRLTPIAYYLVLTAFRFLLSA
jgi:hypothetical protein